MSNIRAFTLSSRTVIVIIDIVFRYFHLECFFLSYVTWIGFRRVETMNFYSIQFLSFFFFSIAKLRWRKESKEGLLPSRRFCQNVLSSYNNQIFDNPDLNRVPEFRHN